MNLSTEQKANARAIITAVRARQLDSWWQTLAICVSLSEASLINVGHGDELDYDTIGLFQQDQSYGTRAQRLDPTHATNAFLDQAERTLAYRGYHHHVPDGLSRSAGAPDAWVHVVGQRIEESEFNNETWPGRGWLAWGANYLGNYRPAREIVTTMGDKMELRDVSDNGFTVLQGKWDDDRLDVEVDTGLTDPGGKPIKILAGVLAGPTAQLAVWSIQQWNTLVEPVISAEGFDYRPKRDSSDVPSEHATGRAWDVNASLHPLDRDNAGTLTGWHMSESERQALESICAATDFDGYGRLIVPGGEWGDGMHLEEAPLNDSESTADRDHRVSQFLGQLGGDIAAPHQIAARQQEQQDQGDDFLMALTDDEQTEIRDKVRWLYSTLRPGIAQGTTSVGATIVAIRQDSAETVNNTRGIRGSAALLPGIKAAVAALGTNVTKALIKK